MTEQDLILKYGKEWPARLLTILTSVELDSIPEPEAREMFRVLEARLLAKEEYEDLAILKEAKDSIREPA